MLDTLNVLPDIIKQELHAELRNDNLEFMAENIIMKDHLLCGPCYIITKTGDNHGSYVGGIVMCVVPKVLYEGVFHKGLRDNVKEWSCDDIERSSYECKGY